MLQHVGYAAIPCRSGFCTVEIRRTSKYMHGSSEVRIPLHLILFSSFRRPSEFQKFLIGPSSWRTDGSDWMKPMANVKFSITDGWAHDLRRKSLQ